MTSDRTILKTRKITANEAQRCAEEQVQFIGTIQPHGFVLVIDKETHNIVQYSNNFLGFINQDKKKPLAKNTPILNTPLSHWMKHNAYTIFDELTSSGSLTISFDEGGLISSNKWECIGSLTNGYVLLEFLPNTHTQTAYHILSSLDRMVAKIRQSTSLQDLFNTITTEFQKHTQYDRVMLYKFFPDWSGEVVSESVSDNTEIQFLGMRFPSEDIPKAARELYATSALRIMTDADANTVGFTPEVLPNGKPLDQSHSVLRGMSLMHIKYLKNMGVKASLSIALMSKGKLWGLMAFHHYTPKVPPAYLVSEMKASCELFAEIIISYLNPALELDKVKKTMEGKRIIEKSFSQIDLTKDDSYEIQQALDSIREVLNKDYIGLLIKDKCYISSHKENWIPPKDLRKKLELLLNKSSGLYYESHKLLEPDNSTVLDPKRNIAGLLMIKSTKVGGLILFFAADESEK